MQKTNVLELGYFFDEPDLHPQGNYPMLVQTLEDGLILPCEWETVIGNGEMVNMLDVFLGYTKFASFWEIPKDSAPLFAHGPYGLGFTQDFLESQNVDPVQYLLLGEDNLPYSLLEWTSQAQTEENAEVADYLREKARTAIEKLKADPSRRALLREKIAWHANMTRTYYELVRPDDLPKSPDDAMLQEWRGTEPVQFTLDDVQTIYLAKSDEIPHFRLMYPSFQGTFVALD